LNYFHPFNLLFIYVTATNIPGLLFIVAFISLFLILLLFSCLSFNTFVKYFFLNSESYQDSRKLNALRGLCALQSIAILGFLVSASNFPEIFPGCCWLLLEILLLVLLWL